MEVSMMPIKGISQINKEIGISILYEIWLISGLFWMGIGNI
jgi:hypothetical protein